jgi:hypothetical protein
MFKKHLKEGKIMNIFVPYVSDISIVIILDKKYIYIGKNRNIDIFMLQIIYLLFLLR